MAKFFIDRPIFAWVIAIFIIAAGIIGIRSLPVSQYPSVAAPTITLTATYPGASAQVMEDSVLAVIERRGWLGLYDHFRRLQRQRQRQHHIYA